MIRFIIAGLGNPGREYEGTKHNAGFEVLDILAKNWNIKIKKLKFQSLYVENNGVLLLKPQLYMNRSGLAVSQASRYFNIPPERILVIFDDISLPIGKLRVRRDGSDGGHNGIKDILYHLESDQFPRIKIGVGGKPHPEADLADHVLSGFSKEDTKTVIKTYEKAAECAVCILNEGVDCAMNKYNGNI